MTKRDYKVRMAYLGMTLDELRIAIIGRGNVNPTTCELSKIKNHENKTKREMVIWSEIDAVTREKMKTVRDEVLTQARAALIARGLAMPEDSLSCSLIEGGEALVFDGDGRPFARYDCEKRRVTAAW